MKELNTNSIIRKEYIIIEKELDKLPIRISIIKKIYPKLLKNELNFKIKDFEFKKPEFETIEAKYNSLSKLLTRNNKETYRTQHEKVFSKKIAHNTKKKIYPSFWIGPFCIDLFIPNMGSSHNSKKRRMRGLALEIDGPIHNLESKMKKDSAKGDFLLSLNIGILSIPNEEFNEKTIRIILNDIKYVNFMDSRERKRQFLRIYLLTLATHLKTQDFLNLFNINNKFVEEFKNV